MRSIIQGSTALFIDIVDRVFEAAGVGINALYSAFQTILKAGPAYSRHKNQYADIARISGKCTRAVSNCALLCRGSSSESSIAPILVS